MTCCGELKQIEIEPREMRHNHHGKNITHMTHNHIVMVFPVYGVN